MLYPFGFSFVLIFPPQKKKNKVHQLSLKKTNIVQMLREESSILQHDTSPRGFDSL